MPPTELIAELSTAHGGDRAWQETLIESCAVAGFDYAKFQSFETRHLKASDPQWFWLSRCELSNADHNRLVKKCSEVGVSFLTTVYTWDKVHYLHDLGLHAIKVGSGEGGDLKLLEEVSRYDWRIFLSTGLWTDEDMDNALRILRGSNVTLLHTVSEYPTLLESVNLGRIAWLHDATGLPVGYSDHTIGKEAALAAIGMRVPVLEVHHALPGSPRQQPWDKSLQDLRRLGEFARSVERMHAPHPIVKPPGEKRPYVGRWQA